MEVILQKNYPSLGYVGDRVKVSPGFARNFLIPRGIVVEASGRNERQVAHILAGVNKRREKMRAEASEYSMKLAQAKLEFTLKIGEGGKFFGSVTARDIESSLKQQGYDVVRKQIRVPEAFKKPGEYTISVKLHAEVSTELKVSVKSDAPAKKEAAEGAEATGGEAPRKRGAKGAAKGGARRSKGAEGDVDAEQASSEGDGSKAAKKSAE